MDAPLGENEFKNYKDKLDTPRQKLEAKNLVHGQPCGVIYERPSDCGNSLWEVIELFLRKVVLQLLSWSAVQKAAPSFKK